MDHLLTKVNPNKVSYWIRGPDDCVVRAHHTQLRKCREPPSYIKKHPYYVQLDRSQCLEAEDHV